MKAADADWTHGNKLVQVYLWCSSYLPNGLEDIGSAQSQVYFLLSWQELAPGHALARRLRLSNNYLLVNPKRSGYDELQ